MPRAKKLAAWLIAFTIAATPVIAGAFVSRGWSWGWDHLHRLPIVWTILVMATLVLGFVPACRIAIERGVDIAGDALHRRSLVWPLTVGIAAGLLCAAFPIATRVYGDSLVFLKYHGPESLAGYGRDLATLGIRFRGSAVLALHDIVARVTGLDLASSYRLVGALCVGIFLACHVRLAAVLPGVPGWARAAIVWLGIVDGANLLFLGHVETYAVPRLLTCLFLMRVTHSLVDPEHARPRARDLLWAALAVFCHLQAVILLPTALLWIIWWHSRLRPELRRWTTARTVVWALGAATVALAALYAASGAFSQNYFYSGGNPTLAQTFLPISTRSIENPYLRYTLFSPAHLLDFFGSLWSISSAATLFILLFLLPRCAHRREVVVLVSAVYLAAVHDFVLNPSIGFPFDWDLMAVISPPLLYVAVFLLASAHRAPIAPLAQLPGLGLATIALFVVNVRADSARERVQDMALWLHRSYYGGTHYRLNASFAGIGDRDQEILARERVFRRLLEQTVPPDPEVAMEGNNLGLLCYERGDVRRALRVFRAVVAVAPEDTSYLKPLGILETVAGNPLRGISLLDAYLKARPDDATALNALGDAWLAQRRPQLARRYWDEVLRVAPGSSEATTIRESLADLGEP
jgi:hypothetical protein